MGLRDVFLLLSLVLVFFSGFFFGVYYAVSFGEHSATVRAAAVTNDGRGALALITARLTPGYGRVFVSVEPKTMLDTQESAEIAAYVAQKLAGQPLGFRDMLFHIKANSQIVGGPSAGAAMTIAAYGALTGKQPRLDVVITGEIHPDGSIGPVGGLLEKLQACAEGGVKVFLIPKGERYYTYMEPYKEVYEPVPGFRIVRTGYRRKTVDLVEEGKKLGVKVVEVGQIEEALPYFFRTESSS